MKPAKQKAEKDMDFIEIDDSRKVEVENVYRILYRIFCWIMRKRYHEKLTQQKEFIDDMLKISTSDINSKDIEHRKSKVSHNPNPEVDHHKQNRSQEGAYCSAHDLERHTSESSVDSYDTGDLTPPRVRRPRASQSSDSSYSDSFDPSDSTSFDDEYAVASFKRDKKVRSSYKRAIRGLDDSFERPKHAHTASFFRTIPEKSDLYSSSKLTNKNATGKMDSFNSPKIATKNAASKMEAYSSSKKPNDKVDAVDGPKHTANASKTAERSRRIPQTEAPASKTPQSVTPLTIKTLQKHRKITKQQHKQENKQVKENKSSKSTKGKVRNESPPSTKYSDDSGTTFVSLATTMTASTTSRYTKNPCLRRSSPARSSSHRRYRKDSERDEKGRRKPRRTHSSDRDRCCRSRWPIGNDSTRIVDENRRRERSMSPKITNWRARVRSKSHERYEKRSRSSGRDNWRNNYNSTRSRSNERRRDRSLSPEDDYWDDYRNTRGKSHDRHQDRSRKENWGDEYGSTRDRSFKRHRDRSISPEDDYWRRDYGSTNSIKNNRRHDRSRSPGRASWREDYDNSRGRYHDRNRDRSVSPDDSYWRRYFGSTNSINEERNRNRSMSRNDYGSTSSLNIRIDRSRSRSSSVSSQNGRSSIQRTRSWSAIETGEINIEPNMLPIFQKQATARRKANRNSTSSEV